VLAGYPFAEKYPGFDGATVTRKLAVLAHHCDQVGRPFDTIEKTISTRVDANEPADQFAGRLERLAALGLEHAVVITSGPWTEDTVTRLAAAARGGQG
jgi:hypothetical protein